MQEISIKIFPFHELNETSKERVIHFFREINIKNKWYESIFEDADKIGLKLSSNEIQDGIINSVAGEFIYSHKNVAKSIISKQNEKFKIYSLAKEFLNYMESVSKKVAVSNNRKMYLIKESFRIKVVEYYIELLKDRYKLLISKEAIVSSIKEKNYWFLENGSLYSTLK